MSATTTDTWTSSDAANDRIATAFWCGIALVAVSGLVGVIALQQTGTGKLLAAAAASVLAWVGSLGVLAGVIGWGVKHGVQAADRSR